MVLAQPHILYIFLCSLMAQNEVYNYLKSRPLSPTRQVALMPWPGEYRFPGGRRLDDEPSPLHTGVRHVLQLFPGMRKTDASDISDVHARLSKKTVSHSGNNQFQVYCIYYAFRLSPLKQLL